MSRIVVIASGVRTAVGDFGGSLACISPCDLGAAVTREAVTRAGLSGADIEQSVFGHVIHTAPEDMYLARVVAMRAGVPDTAPALTLNRLCSSGLQAVVTAANMSALTSRRMICRNSAPRSARTARSRRAMPAGSTMVPPH